MTQSKNTGFYRKLERSTKMIEDRNILKIKLCLGIVHLLLSIKHFLRFCMNYETTTFIYLQNFSIKDYEHLTLYELSSVTKVDNYYQTNKNYTILLRTPVSFDNQQSITQL